MHRNQQSTNFGDHVCSTYGEFSMGATSDTLVLARAVRWRYLPAGRYSWTCMRVSFRICRGSGQCGTGINTMYSNGRNRPQDEVYVSKQRIGRSPLTAISNLIRRMVRADNQAKCERAQSSLPLVRDCTECQVDTMGLREPTVQFGLIPVPFLLIMLFLAHRMAE